MAWCILVYLALNLIGLGVVLAKHGETRTGKNNFWISLFMTAVIVALLYFGGAFHAIGLN